MRHGKQLPGGTILWQRAFADTANAAGNQNNTLAATAISAVPSGDTNSGDINPIVGITGTPVIDPATNTLYLVAKTKETIAGAAHFVQRLHAINIADGTDRTAPFLIGDTKDGNTNNTPIYVCGTGDGNVPDSRTHTNKSIVEFNALREHHRGALSLVNGTLYVQWASHGDNGPYHGWVVSWNVRDITTAGFQLAGVLNVSPNTGLAGIWQSGGRLVFEPGGSAFYFETGNGSGGAPKLDANGFPTNASYGEALVKVVADPATNPAHQNANGWGLKVADYFIPYNIEALDKADSDFGSGSPVILPDSAGIPGHSHLLVAGGKDGKLYVFDRDHLGHFDPNNDHVLNAVPNGSGQNTPDKAVPALFSTPAWFNNKLYVVGGMNGAVVAYKLETTGKLTTLSQSNSQLGYLPGSPVVSSNGNNNAIVWAADRAANVLRAFDGNTMATELWNSSQRVGDGDHLDMVIKFAVPTVCNGQVFVGTGDSLVSYGLAQPPNAEPAAPMIAATALWGSSINLTWTDTSRQPNIAAGYAIEQSTDRVHFNKITDAPAGATSVAVGLLSKSTKYYFRVHGLNAKGNSLDSNIADATTTDQISAIDFSGGFPLTGNQLTHNGTVTIKDSKLRLTDSANNQVGSAFYAALVDITRFNTRFTFNLSPGGTADGFTFAIQNAGPTAMGIPAGGLGYGNDPNSGNGGIPKSMAIKFDLYDNQGEGPNSTGLFINGATPTNNGSIDLSPSGIDLHNGNPCDVTLAYDGVTLIVTITDTQMKKSATQKYPIDIPKTVGGGTAYVGFTGGTGGLGAVQDILHWTFSPTATTSPNAPSGLGAVAASATSINLNWTSNAPNQAGYHLDRAADDAFTKSLTTANLPLTPASYTDASPGLNPGGTYYYRLRACNSVGDSGNSNIVRIVIPLAPPTPNNQKIDSITATQINLSWQDNAGHKADGYRILRNVNHGTFTIVATLPPTSRPTPSRYEWTDSKLTPNTAYEYHIHAFNVSGNNDFAGLNVTTPAK